MAKYYDRDTKLAYVEQINAGRLSPKAAARELGCATTTVYSWIRKLREDGVHGLPGSGHMKSDLEYQRGLEKGLSVSEMRSSS